MSNKNPYHPLQDNNAIDALIAAKSLRGFPNARKVAMGTALKEWSKFKKGEEDCKLEEFKTLLCDDIITERETVGRDWVVAQAFPTRKLRELVQSILGPDLVFVVLDLEKGLQRLQPRLGSFDMKYEAAQDDEENTFDIKITREMALEKVVDVIM